jgi:hypothetical protein
MKYRITSQLTILTYETALKSFWYKNALKKFLRGCNISENFLNTWNEQETKRIFLDRLFNELQKKDAGKKVLLDISLALSEQTTFPDLRNVEDSKDKINDAHIAVSELRDFFRKQTEQIESEATKTERRKMAYAENIQIQREMNDKQKLKESLEILSKEIGSQEAGYKFQDWFYSLVDFCDIEHKKPYKKDGRQIDGSITLNGTTYLVELKFTTTQSDATDIDSIKAKINKVADNTMGILISISGYTSVAISEASGPKTTLLLMDSSHLFYFLTGGMEFKDIIARINRHASQTGESYLPVSKFNI